MATKKWASKANLKALREATDVEIKKQIAAIPATDLSGYFNAPPVYNSSTKKIEFYHDTTKVAELDATPFIKDGMVNTVSITDGKTDGANNGKKVLLVTFNTDAGQEDIEIPLEGIFNANNYYDKDAVDGLISTAKGEVTKVLTIKRNGSEVGTYDGTAAKELNITVPTNTNELTNGAGFIDATALEGYAKTSEVEKTLEPYAKTAEVSTSIEKALEPYAKTADLDVCVELDEADMQEVLGSWYQA